MNKFSVSLSGKNVALVVALGAIGSLAAGCPSTPRTDAGTDTGNVVVLPDARSTRDAPARVDAAVTLPAGACGAAIADLFAPLPTGCLPRCAASTVTAIQACVDASTTMCNMDMVCDTCIENALLADRTASAQVYIGDDMSGAPVLIEVNCGGAPMGSMANIWDCETWQQYSCISDSCPTEFAAALTCFQMNPMNGNTACATQLTALRTCQTTNMTELQSCVTSRARACYEGLGGFAPGSEAPIHSSMNSARLTSFAQIRASLQH